MNNIGKLLMATGFGDLAGPLETIASGRKLARHSSGMGTVMEFNDGKPRRVLVLDAQYRSNQATGVYGKEMKGLPELIGPYRHLNTSSDSFISTIDAASVTDSWINTNMAKDTNTAKQSCDIYMKYQYTTGANVSIDGSPAVIHCRSILVSGTPCDLPNIQTLARIYCDAEAIDARDPSKDTHPTYLLGSRNTQGNWFIGPGSGSYKTSAWSSTQFNPTDGWLVEGGGLVTALYCRKYNKCAVIPVLEL